MKVRTAALAAAGSILALSAGTASAQGLLSIDSVSDYWEDVPFTILVNAGGGWDSNSNGSSDDAQESAYISGDVSVAYGSKGERTNYSIGGGLGVVHYLDGSDGLDDTNYTAKVFFNLAHGITPRLSLSNNAYVTYEIEPDYDIGASTNRRNGQYYYFYDQLSLTYAWTQRLSTVVSGSIAAIRYEDSELADQEDRMTYGAGLTVRYRLTPKTSLLGEYRWGMTDYNSLTADSSSHYLLAGVEHAFSPRLNGSFRVGAQYYDSDRASEISPYAETSLNYLVDRRTSVRWYGRLGYEGSELGLFDSRYSLRTGLVANHQFSERLTGNAGIHYAFSKFKLGDTVLDEANDVIRDAEDALADTQKRADELGVELTDDQLAAFDVDLDDLGVPTEDLDEHQINFNVGLAYRLFANVDLNGGYTYTNIMGNDSEREFDRHRIYIGAGARF